MEVDITNRISRYIKFVGIALVLLVFALGTGIYLYQHRSADIELSDAVVRGDMIDVKTKTRGVLAAIIVQDGDAVETAAPILALTVPIGEAELKQLEEAAALAKQNLTNLQRGITVVREAPAAAGAGSASLAAAQERLDRMNKLYEMGAVSALKRDQAQAEYQAALAASGAAGRQYQTSVQPASPEAIKQSETALKQAEVAFANAKESLDAATVKAPVAGIVHLLPLSLGQSMEEDTTVGQVESRTSFHIEATAAPADKAKFAVGQPVQYEIGGRLVQGMVQEITEDDASVRLYISIPADATGYASGDRLTVRILR